MSEAAARLFRVISSTPFIQLQSSPGPLPDSPRCDSSTAPAALIPHGGSPSPPQTPCTRRTRRGGRNDGTLEGGEEDPRHGGHDDEKTSDEGEVEPVETLIDCVEPRVDRSEASSHISTKPPDIELDLIEITLDANKIGLDLIEITLDANKIGLDSGDIHPGSDILWVVFGKMCHECLRTLAAEQVGKTIVEVGTSSFGDRH